MFDTGATITQGSPSLFMVFSAQLGSGDCEAESTFKCTVSIAHGDFSWNAHVGMAP